MLYCKNIYKYLIALILVFSCGIFPILFTQQTGNINAAGETVIVSFNTDGAGELNNENYIVGQEYKLPVVSRSGYEFLGWYYNTELIPNNGEWSINEANITLTANWKLETYSITYKGIDGVLVNENPDNFNITTPDIVLKPVEKDGYTFNGWINANVSTTTMVTKIVPNNIANNIELTASWDIIEYTIKYMNVDNLLNKNILNYNIETDYTLQAVNKFGFDFVGWYTNLEDESTQIKKINLGTTGNLVLYPKWVVKKCTITFDVPGIDSVTKNFDETIDLPTPEKDGYIFGGWYTDDAMNIEFTNESKVQKDLKLKAKWIKKVNIGWYIAGGVLGGVTLIMLVVYIFYNKKRKMNGFEL